VGVPAQPSAIVVLIVFSTRFLLKVIATVLDGFEHPAASASPASILTGPGRRNKLIRFGILALMIVLLYPYLPGSSSEGLSRCLGIPRRPDLAGFQLGVRQRRGGNRGRPTCAPCSPATFVQVGDYTGTVIDKTSARDEDPHRQECGDHAPRNSMTADHARPEL